MDLYNSSFEEIVTFLDEKILNQQEIQITVSQILFNLKEIAQRVQVCEQQIQQISQEHTTKR